MAELVDDLKRQALELRETHISWVFLFERTVLKLKKPVNFGFLDFSSLESRLRACEAEVALNARLAPGVYLGVVPIMRGADGVHAIGGQVLEAPLLEAPLLEAPLLEAQLLEAQAAVVDFGVHMRRLADADRADVRLREGRLEWAQLAALAVTLASFHARCAAGPEIAELGRGEAIARNVEENFAQAQRSLAQLATPAQEQEVERWQLGFLYDHAALFEERRASGRVRDGHGDLRLEHVYFPEAGAQHFPGAEAQYFPGAEAQAPVVIDCIEFNERFRYADVCADVAFLSMDLAWHGRSELKERFLAAYARASADYDLYSVVDFYESYRAYVRAKVSALGLGSRSLPFDERQRLEAEARRYLLLAVASERPSLAPARLIAVGGVIASGKSTLADALGHELALPVLSTDRTRKALLGLSPTEHITGAAAERAYAAAFSERVYAEVLRQAGVVLASGRSLVVDASFRSRAARAELRALAAAAHVPFVFVECRAAPDVARARLRAREEVASVSDARLELFDEFVASYEPVTELAPGEHILLDTSGTLAESLEPLRNAGLLPEGVAASGV